MTYGDSSERVLDTVHTALGEKRRLLELLVPQGSSSDLDSVVVYLLLPRHKLRQSRRAG